MCLAASCAGTLYIHFWGLLPLREICQVQNLLYVQVLCSPLLAALVHGTQVVGVSQTLRRCTRNGITELSQTAPPIFGRAAITLGIGPHSRSILCLHSDKTWIHDVSHYQRQEKASVLLNTDISKFRLYHVHSVTRTCLRCLFMSNV